MREHQRCGVQVMFDAVITMFLAGGGKERAIYRTLARRELEVLMLMEKNEQTWDGN